MPGAGGAGAPVLWDNEGSVGGQSETFPPGPRMHLKMQFESVRHPVWPDAQLAAYLVVGLLATGCSGDAAPEGASSGGGEDRVVADHTAAAPIGDRPRIVVLGDSLTAGLGVNPHEAFPARLQEKLATAGYAHEIVNAGVSADTTAGGLRRLEWSLDGDVRVVIVALGGNDGLRGLAVDEMKQNLAEIIEGAEAYGARVLLTGMEAPPNYGPFYTKAFRNAFGDLADAFDLAFVPFLLNGVAGQAELNQADGIHPNAEGAGKVADLVWLTLEPMLEQGGPTT